MIRYLKFALPIIFMSLLCGGIVWLLASFLNIDTTNLPDFVTGMIMGGLVFKEAKDDN